MIERLNKCKLCLIQQDAEYFFLRADSLGTDARIRTAAAHRDTPAEVVAEIEPVVVGVHSAALQLRWAKRLSRTSRGRSALQLRWARRLSRTSRGRSALRSTPTRRVKLDFEVEKK